MAEYSKEYGDKCVGRPIGWTGGPVQYCGSKIQLGTRFCYRCHIVAIAHAQERLISLKGQVARAEHELGILLEEVRITVR